MYYNKKYIIISLGITTMGGGQMYVRNKILYMQSNGWDVDVFSAVEGTVYIAELKKFKHITPELRYPIYLFSKSTRERIINMLIEAINIKQYNEIIIESTCLGGSTWAEVLAQRIGAKHFFFSISEQTIVQSKTIIQDFLIFKHKRHELAGIANQSIYNLFLQFHPININESYRLSARCNNVVEDIPCPLLKDIDVKKYDYVIGCLSRLDKPFIAYAIKDLISYVNAHNNKKYLLIMIGGAPEKTSYEQNIRRMLKNIHNIELIITGYMYPIPTKLLDICDAFFSSAGSSRACMRSGIPTINYDVNDYRPIGIIGRTTNNLLMRADNEPIQDFSKLMDDILERKIYGKEERIQQINKPDFSSHDKFLSSMSPKKEYFEFNNYNKIQMGRKEKVMSFLLRAIGAHNVSKLIKLKSRMLNHLHT